LEYINQNQTFFTLDSHRAFICSVQQKACSKVRYKVITYKSSAVQVRIPGRRSEPGFTATTTPTTSTLPPPTPPPHPTSFPARPTAVGPSPPPPLSPAPPSPPSPPKRRRSIFSGCAARFSAPTAVSGGGGGSGSEKELSKSAGQPAFPKIAE